MADVFTATVRVDGRLPEPQETVKAIRDGLRAGLNHARRRARALAPKGGPYVGTPPHWRRSGNLSRSIRVRVSSSGQRVTGRIGTKLFYARFVEKGTQAHEIKPEKARRLFFLGPDGQPAFAMAVKHPGAPARPFLEPAVQQSRQNIADEIEFELQYAAGIVGDESAAKQVEFAARSRVNG